MSAARRTSFCLAVLLTTPLAPVWAAPAAAPAPTPAPAASAMPAPTPNPAAELLVAADQAIERGSLEQATTLYQRVQQEHPATPEAHEARRALRILGARASVPAAPAPAAVPASPQMPPAAPPAAPPRDPDTVIRQDPYSLRTAERLRLNTWEKLDFGVTAFLYGMSVGATYAIGLDPNDSDGALPRSRLGPWPTPWVRSRT